jgi:hypothetical protein
LSPAHKNPPEKGRKGKLRKLRTMFASPRLSKEQLSEIYYDMLDGKFDKPPLTILGQRIVASEPSKPTRETGGDAKAVAAKVAEPEEKKESPGKTDPPQPITLVEEFPKAIRAQDFPSSVISKLFAISEKPPFLLRAEDLALSMRRLARDKLAGLTHDSFRHDDIQKRREIQFEDRERWLKFFRKKPGDS